MSNEQQQPNERGEEQPPEEEKRPLSLGQSLSYGTGTFLAAGLVDLLGHLGPTGLVVGGIVAYAVAKHGPELVEQVREALPSPPAPPAVPRHVKQAHTARQGGGSKRSILDRTLGRFPAQEDTPLEDVDTVLVDEPETEGEPLRPMRWSAMQIAHPIRLSPNLVLEADEIVGAGINVFGVKGSGKTVTVARLAEQFAPWRISEVVFDIKGDLDSLVTNRRADGRAYVPNGYVGVRGCAPSGRSVLANGLQVVYDLRTWQTPEQMATLVCVVVEEMLETVALTPEGDLAPCLVFLDEAEYWLPQAQPSYLSVHTYRRLLDAFHMLATMGRSRGLAPVIATQRIAKVNKDIIAQAEMNIFMKAMLDIDLDRYYDYFNKSLVSRERIRSFQEGEAVVCLPDGSQMLIRFLERESRHRSHTPHVTAALNKFGDRAERGPVELDGDRAVAARVPSADHPLRRVTVPPQAVPYPEQHAAPGPLEEYPNQVSQTGAAIHAVRPARVRLTPELERGLQAWHAGATSVTKLEKALGITHHQAYKIYTQLHKLRLV
jgi:hypothetical protein